MQPQQLNELSIIENQIREEEQHYTQALKKDLPFAFLKEIKEKIKYLKDELNGRKGDSSNNCFS